MKTKLSWVDKFYIKMFNFWNFKSMLCPKCNTYNRLSNNWDYEKCKKCYNYLYDNRGIL